MSKTKTKGVSVKTHTRQQLNDYANQHNPNNKAYKAKRQNMVKMRSANQDARRYENFNPEYDWDPVYHWHKDDF